MVDNAHSILVIVPDEQGVQALAGVPGVTAVVVAADQAVPAGARGAEILVVGPAEQQNEVDAALRQISQLPNLKLLQTLGQGTEQWDGVLPTSVTVLTARGAHGGSVAEWVLAVLLTLLRDLPQYRANQRGHVWQGRQAQTLLASKVLVYGAGDVGDNVRRRLEPFGAQVTMVGGHARDNVIDTATAQTLLPETDVVIMALPLTPATENIVNAALLAALPDRAVIVNAGRGGLVDQGALLQELQRGRLRAALDVTTPEPLPVGNPLWEAPGLLLTPHVAGNTVGSDTRAWQAAVDEIRKFLG